MKKGFTLIEVLVAVAIFVSVMVVAGSAFVSAIQAQRYNLAYQELLDQTSYAMEHMSRTIRMAKKATADVCGLGEGDNYNISSSNSIQFIDQYGDCAEFFWDKNTNELKKRAGTQTTPLTSPSLRVDNFNVSLGTSLNQPIVTIVLEVTGAEDTNILIETSVSQRDLNL